MKSSCDVPLSLLQCLIVKARIVHFIKYLGTMFVLIRLLDTPLLEIASRNSSDNTIYNPPLLVTESGNMWFTFQTTTARSRRNHFVVYYTKEYSKMKKNINLLSRNVHVHSFFYLNWWCKNYKWAGICGQEA